MRDLLDRLPLVIASEIDRDLRVTFLNKAAMTANGCALAEVQGLRVTDIWPDVEQAAPLWEAAWRTGVEQHITHPVALLDGKMRWLATTFAPRADGGLVVASIEVTAAVELATLKGLTAALMSDPFAFAMKLQIPLWNQPTAR